MPASAAEDPQHDHADGRSLHVSRRDDARDPATLDGEQEAPVLQELQRFTEAYVPSDQMTDVDDARDLVDFAGADSPAQLISDTVSSRRVIAERRDIDIGIIHPLERLDDPPSRVDVREVAFCEVRCMERTLGDREDGFERTVFLGHRWVDL